MLSAWAEAVSIAVQMCVVLQEQRNLAKPCLPEQVLEH